MKEYYLPSIAGLAPHSIVLNKDPNVTYEQIRKRVRRLSIRELEEISCELIMGQITGRFTIEETKLRSK